VALLDGFGFGVYDHARPLTVFDAKTAFKGVVLANNSYTRDVAEEAIRSGVADFVSFGRPNISTDLAGWFKKDQPLNPDATPDDSYSRSDDSVGADTDHWCHSRRSVREVNSPVT
jgi:N-ethylmaleimide reductase